MADVNTVDPVATEEALPEAEPEVAEKGYDPQAKWFIPHKLQSITYIGKDVLAVAEDIYIAFYNLKNNTELVYVANSHEVGDGVDVIAGYKTYIFAFAEKIKNARIFVVAYPSFNVLAIMQDADVNRYKGLCMMECDLIAGFTGFPNYLISIWSWRTQQQLYSIPTGVMKRDQIYLASRTHMLICECWGEGLIVWEVAQCYKRTLMMRRAKNTVFGWEVSDPTLIAIAFNNEGHLYALDNDANLYGLLSDGIGMISTLEWSANLKGLCKPLLCHFGSGLLVYGPDMCIRFLKKTETKWKVVTTFIPHEEVLRLISNCAGEVAAAWTVNGLVYRIVADEDKIEATPVVYKQRHITNLHMIAPDYRYLATMNDTGVLCIYEASNGFLVWMKQIVGTEVVFAASPVTDILAIISRVGENYGVRLVGVEETGIRLGGSMCLTHQEVSKLAFSPTGRHLMAAAMSAGHVFIFSVSDDLKLNLVRYSEIGRGLADCFLMKVGSSMRAFSLVLFSDKYLKGERITCINAETGKDNKFAGKMQGPYGRLLPVSAKDTMLAIPHLSRHFHILKLSGEKGVTVTVKMGPIIEAGHDIKQFDGIYAAGLALITFGYDGHVILRKPDQFVDFGTSEDPKELKLCVSHRYNVGGVKLVSLGGTVLATGAGSCCTVTDLFREVPTESAGIGIHRPHITSAKLNLEETRITIITEGEKNYLDVQEEKKVHEEAMDVKGQRDDIVKGVESVRARLVALLEENIAERPLHQLSLAEFNLHLEHKKERYKQAERDREDKRLSTESLIRAQDRVTDWIRKMCWDTMLNPRIKLFAIFSHYHVENFPVLPSQRETWPELQQIEALRTMEMENDDDLFRPWEEAGVVAAPRAEQITRRLTAAVGLASTPSVMSTIQSLGGGDEGDEDKNLERDNQMQCLAGSAAFNYITPIKYAVPQTIGHSFLHMNWMHHVTKLTGQNLRIWYNKQFDELVTQKKREVGLVVERNNRLRFIVEELNKLSDLRGSFHHLVMDIRDPEWAQEETPIKLIKVEPEECSIEPYISPSQIVLVPPDPGPKDDFRERALMEMMDGVLEKLWHEEIKKPIPIPQCMLDKDPEQFNEDDLRLVFDYEAKVKFRNEERDKYRKMLHAEYAKLTQLLNEGVVKFNLKVKETWLLKLRVDSIIGQENLNLMRFRRKNLDRIEHSELVEHLREVTRRWLSEIESLSKELALAQEQATEVQAAYDALAGKERLMERTFKNHFADLSPIIVDQCYKFFRKRPKWQSRASMTPVVLNELATAILTGVKPVLLHADVADYFKAIEHLDQITNMPPVMDEGLWVTMCKLRRAKIENEIRIRALGQEMSYVESTVTVWRGAIQARRTQLATTAQRMTQLRETVEHAERNNTVQLVLPAGQVEIVTTGHMVDFDDAILIPREDIEKINNLILRVGRLKLRMMRKQMEFRKGILAKEWEHAQMKMKLRHMRQELYSYQKLRIPKELQLFLKNKELGYTEEQEFVRMEKEMEASKMSVNQVFNQQIHQAEELQLRISRVDAQGKNLEKAITALTMKVSEKRIAEDPLEPIRIRRIFKTRMETLVMRSNLIREVQNNHTTIVMLQTELELLRLKTYPTLASFRTLPPN